MPEWAGELANLYWWKRIARTDAQRRKAWRRIAAQKKRLLDAGVPYIEVHLVSRHLTNPRNPNAEARMRAYFAQGRLFA